MNIKETIDNLVEIILWAVMAFVITLCLQSCTTERIVVTERVTHDTINHAVTKRDSIHIHDSIFHEVITKGDTIYVTRDRWRIQYQNLVKHDSVYIHKTDTVPQVVKVTDEMPWYDTAALWIGRMSVTCFIALMAFFIFKTFG